MLTEQSFPFCLFSQPVQHGITAITVMLLLARVLARIEDLCNLPDKIYVFYNDFKIYPFADSLKIF